jgi:hypothetical protein
MIVGLLIIKEKDLLLGQQYAPDSYFNPIQDSVGDWVISTEEIDQNTNADFDWLNGINLIEYSPVINEPI